MAWTISPGAGSLLDPDEVDPLDMTYDGDLHAGSLTIPPAPAR